jgi:hypothetical protein
MAAMKAKQKTAAGRAHVPAKRGGVTQISDDEYRRLAKQQYEAEGEIEIDPNAKVSRSRRRDRRNRGLRAGVGVRP